MKAIEAVDLFCGAGGESTGLALASQQMGRPLNLVAINHWDIAIESHSENHPDIKHLCETLQNINPARVVPSGHLDLLWASPECIHHSKARSGRPCSEQSRASAWLVLKWLTDLYIERVVIENVAEFGAWGPLDSDGRPIKERRGDTFNAYLAAIESLGYKTDSRILCAANYGDPTSRERLFIQAVRGNGEINWPKITHDAYEGLSPQRTIADILDWSVPSTSIFTRSRPLASTTMARIEAGIQKFWSTGPAPFVVVLRGTSKNHLQKTAISINEPLPTVTAGGGHFALVEPARANSSRWLWDPAAGNQMMIKWPGIDVKLRMFQPHELAAGQGFPSQYRFAGTKADQVRQIGNAVPVNLAKAICLAQLDEAA